MKTANARYHFFRLKAQVAFEVWKLRDLGKDQRAMGFYSDFIGIMNGVYEWGFHVLVGGIPTNPSEK